MGTFPNQNLKQEEQRQTSITRAIASTFSDLTFVVVPRVDATDLKKQLSRNSNSNLGFLIEKSRLDMLTEGPPVKAQPPRIMALQRWTNKAQVPFTFLLRSDWPGEDRSESRGFLALTLGSRCRIKGGFQQASEARVENSVDSALMPIEKVSD